MKARPMKAEYDGDKILEYIPCQASEATHVMLHCPGPFWCRIIPVILKGTRAGTGCWTWNGDIEKPTLRPSLKTCGPKATDEQMNRIRAGENLHIPDTVCHSWIKDGKIQFLPDCTHDLAGQTLDLLECED
jgi:hypothetical protein